jgi:hypothetical protein
LAQSAPTCVHCGRRLTRHSCADGSRPRCGLVSALRPRSRVVHGGHRLHFYSVLLHRYSLHRPSCRLACLFSPALPTCNQCRLTSMRCSAELGVVWRCYAFSSMSAYFRLSCVLILFTSGCVTTRIDKPEHSWPKPIAATDLKQFDGVYLDSALEMLETGKPAPNTTELFVFLLGPTHSHEGDSNHVEIRSTPDGRHLRIRLLDPRHRQIDSALLHRGTDFALSGGAIVVRPGRFT